MSTLKTKNEAAAETNGTSTAKDLAIPNPATAKKMVTKRDGRSEEFSTQKLRKRLDQLLDGLAAEFMGLDACI